MSIGELRLSANDRIDRFESKAGFEVESDYYHLGTDLPEAKGIDPAKVIDITSHLKPDGTLDWTPPAGNWRILRLGYSLLGTMNHPAPPEATGLEVDKFDGPAVRRYLDHYIGMYKDAAGADLIGKRGVQAILTDSIEVGAANWTPAMVEQEFWAMLCVYQAIRELISYATPTGLDPGRISFKRAFEAARDSATRAALSPQAD